MSYRIKLVLLIIVLGSSSAFAQLTPFYSDISNKYGFRNTLGEEVVAPAFDLAYAFSEGLAAVRINGKYGYLNVTGKLVVPPKYDFTWRFIGGFAAVKLGDKFGFIDTTGKEVVPPCYEDANNYHGNCCYKGMAHVKERGQWKIIKLPD